jgi:hypothetical protein
MGARSQLAQAKLAQQQYAQQRFFEQVNQANAMQGAGMQNVAGALGSLGNIGMMMGMYGGNNPLKTQSQGFSTVQKPGLMNNPPVDTTNYSVPSWLNMQGVPSMFRSKFGQSGN